MLEDLCNLESPMVAMMDLPFAGSSFTEELFPNLDFSLITTDDDIAEKKGASVGSAIGLQQNGENILDDLADIDTDNLLTSWNNKKDLGLLEEYLLGKEDHATDCINFPSSRVEFLENSISANVMLKHSGYGKDAIDNVDFSPLMQEHMLISTTDDYAPPFFSSSSDNEVSLDGSTSTQSGTESIDLTATTLFNTLMGTNVSSVIFPTNQTSVNDTRTTIISPSQPTAIREIRKQSTKVDIIPVPKISKNLQITPYSTSANLKPRKGGRRKMPASIKRERKKDQNRSAASRYRMRKKEEKQNIDDEFDDMQSYNQELRKSVESLELEIKYMKDIMKEIPHLVQKAARLGISL